MTTPGIIIAGGGIAGLAAALALGAHEALILEQAEKLVEAGAGLQLGPNAVRALQALGAWDAVEPITSSPPEIHMRDGISGRMLKRVALGKTFERRFGAPYRVAHRADLHEALLQVVRSRPGIALQLAQNITSASPYLDGMSLQINGRTMTCQALLGADGVNSIVRQSLFQAAARESGQTFHRALVKQSRQSSDALDCVNLWMCPNGHVVHYPVGRSQLLNIVAITSRGMLPVEQFAAVTPALQILLQQATSAFTPWKGLFVQPLPTWATGATLLVGDAAHGTLPYLAQGAAMALEDAACLKAVLPTTRSLRHAFAETVQRRKARTDRVHRETLEVGATYHLAGPLRWPRNLALSVLPGSLVLGRLAWLYKG